jgi:YVTN family beta-propeller protein
MTAFNRVEPRIPELMDELAPARVPDYFDDMLRQTARTRQRPAWSSLGMRLPMGVIARSDTLGQVPWRPIAIAAMLIAAAATTLVLIAGSQRRLPSAPFGPTSRIQVGDPIDTRWFAADDTSLWVHQLTSMVRVDLATGAVTGTFPLPWMDYGYDATGAGSVWQTDYENNVLVRIDPVAGKVIKSIPVGLAPAGVAVTEGSVWVAEEHSGAVTRLDPATDLVIATISVGPTGSAGPQILTAGPGGVWVDIQNNHSVVRVDAATNKVGLRVPLEGWLASDGTEVWMGLDGGPGGPSRVVRIDPVSGKVITSVDLGTSDGIVGLAVGLGSVWASAGGGLTRIDTETGRILGYLDTGGDGGNVVVAGGAVWVAVQTQPYVLRNSPP